MHQHHKDLTPKYARYIKFYSFMSQFIQRIVQQIPDIKEILSMKCFSDNKWWWWLRDCGWNRGRHERNLEWQDETGEEQDPTRWGAWEAVCSAAWLTHNCSATARAPPRVGETEHNALRLWAEKYTCSDAKSDRKKYTERHKRTHKRTVSTKCKLFGCHVCYFWIKGRWGIDLCICSRKEELKLTDSFNT